MFVEPGGVPTCHHPSAPFVKSHKCAMCMSPAHTCLDHHGNLGQDTWGACEGCVTTRKYLGTGEMAFSTADMKLTAGATSQAHSFDVAKLECARGGFYMFSSIVSVYRAAGFTMYSGVASRWAWEVLPSIEKFVGQCMPHQVARSLPYGDQTSSYDGPTLRILPWHGLSSFALVVMLVRWCAAPSRQGGLLCDKARRACSVLLDGVCDSIFRGKRLEKVVFMDDDFEHRWPRPPSAERPVHIVIEDPGCGGVGCGSQSLLSRSTELLMTAINVTNSSCFSLSWVCQCCLASGIQTAMTPPASEHPQPYHGARHVAAYCRDARVADWGTHQHWVAQGTPLVVLCYPGILARGSVVGEGRSCRIEHERARWSVVVMHVQASCVCVVRA